MKKIMIAVMLMACVGVAKATEVGDNFAISGLAYDANFDFPSGSDLANRIGAIVTYTSMTFTASTFTDGQTSSGTLTVVSTASLAGESVTINGYKFCAGVTNISCPASATTSFFAVGANVNATATNLAAAINGHAILGSLITATANSAAVNLVSEACDGVGYTIASSSAKITKGGNMGGGVIATVFKATDKITIANHGYQTGVKVGLSGSSLPSPFTATDYWVLKVDANNIRLSSTSALAQAGSYIDITNVAIGATAHTFTLTPAAISGTPSFKWQASNDATYWVDMSVSSVTMSGYTAGGTSSYWDFSWYPFKWLRLKVIGPTTGGIYLKSSLSVKK